MGVGVDGELYDGLVEWEECMIGREEEGLELRFRGGEF